MITATKPNQPRREWWCVYCTARGPATSEAHQVEQTKAHLVGCRVRVRYEARIARAMAVMGGER